MTSKIRAIAFYLPQFHSIPENDKWWGKGFTEWTNVTKAKPLYKGHRQPNLPSDLGFYDLRLPEVRQQQADLARNAGIEGFCYWHYWFGNGKRLLERPFNEVLNTGEPDFPFCLAWANQTWTGIWHGAKNRILIKQEYPGLPDYIKHFEYLLTAFRDDRYITIDGLPLFLIYKPLSIPNLDQFIDIFREMSLKSGLKGIHISGCFDTNYTDPETIGLDSIVYSNFRNINRCSKKSFSKLNVIRKINQIKYLINKHPVKVFDYKDAIKAWEDYDHFKFQYFPVAIPNWDNSPRSGNNSYIIQNSTPDQFQLHLNNTLERVKERPQNQRLIFIKSWNEWAEGNYLEPDIQFQDKYLKAVSDVLLQTNKNSQKQV